MRRSASQAGTNQWFDTIVATAIAHMTTIDVAAENPPRNTSSASMSWPAAAGRVST